jgi:anaerobic magnesium-protoporphyrin IX monomethyl ester cyclase
MACGTLLVCMLREDVRYLLINVPLTDPTASYHSIPYLFGATAKAGFTGFRGIDANIEALNFMAQPEELGPLLDDAAHIRQRLEQQPSLTRAEQIAYRYALRAVGLTRDSMAQAIGILRDAERFYDYGSYRQATMVLKRWLDVLSLRGFPGQFGDFTLRINNVGNLSSLTDLTNLSFIEQLTRPLQPYFESQFSEVLREQPWHLVGLSVNYTGQLPFALQMAKQIRQALPNTILCVGGTEISDELKCLRTTSDIWKLFPDCDAVVGGEGESVLLAILRSIADNKSLPDGQPGLVLKEAALPMATIAVSYENVAELPPPRYDVFDLSQYWSPEPVLLYSPTRGCYWNKCTFCDYGLNTDLPTSPSRNRPVESVIDELRHIRQYARTFYFSVDAIAPAYLRKLAQAIAANGLDIHWSAELRLEKSMLKDGMARELRDAGCVAVSFGYESGCQRVLDLINKGVRLEQVPDLLAELSRHGIAAQMMGFIGFPGETTEEASQTFEFLLQHRSNWTLAGIGDFILTPGAIVAKRPADFGIQSTQPFDGDDIVRTLYWTDAHGRRHFDGGSHDASIQPLAESVANFVDDRPFVGGIDSAHSILYFAHYGAELVPPAQRDSLADDPILSTQRYATPLSGIDEFTARGDVVEFHRQRRREGRSTTVTELEAWLSEAPTHGVAAASGGETLAIYPNGHFIRETNDLADFERDASPAYHSLKMFLLRESGIV